MSYLEEIKALKEQNELLKQFIETQKQLIEEIIKHQFAPFVSIPSVWQCQHEYPFPWHATIPPNCKKCGQQAPSYTVTCSDTIVT